MIGVRARPGRVVLTLAGGLAVLSALTGSVPDRSALAGTAAITARASSGVTSGGASATGSVSVGGTAYRLSTRRLPNGRQVILRWNPCQTITYRVNVAAVPRATRARVLAETRSAVSRLSTATGLRFRYRGTTSEVPRSGSMTRQSAELIIAVTTPARTNFPIGGSAIGYGGRVWYWWSRTSGSSTVYGAAITRGFVVLDVAALRRLRPGFAAGQSQGNLLLHELGHAVGLDHAARRSSLMYPQLLTSAPNGYAAGDRAGLLRVGRRAGCIAVPRDLPTRDLN